MANMQPCADTTSNGPIRGTPAAEAAGVQRRVIEGEGLGGFARRIQSSLLLPCGSGAADNFFRSGASTVASVPDPPWGRLSDAELAEISRKLNAAAAWQDDIA